MAEQPTVPYYHRNGPNPCNGLAFVATRRDFSFGRRVGDMLFRGADGVTAIDGSALQCWTCQADLGGRGNEVIAPGHAAEMSV